MWDAGVLELAEPNLTTGRMGWQRTLFWGMILPLSARQRRTLEQGLAQGRTECPRCGGALEQQVVRPRPGVAYVRDRVWVVCVDCGASAVVDRRRIERARDGSP